MLSEKLLPPCLTQKMTWTAWLWASLGQLCPAVASTRRSLISSCSIAVQQRLNLAQWYWILVPAFFPVCCCSSKELAESLLYHIWSVDNCSSTGLEHCRSFHLEKYGSPSCLLLPLPTENLPFVFPDSRPNKIHQNNTGDTEGISCLKLGLGATHATISCLASEVMWVESRQGFTSRDCRFAQAALQTGIPLFVVATYSVFMLGQPSIILFSWLIESFLGKAGTEGLEVWWCSCLLANMLWHFRAAWRRGRKALPPELLELLPHCWSFLLFQGYSPE